MWYIHIWMLKEREGIPLHTFFVKKCKKDKGAPLPLNCTTTFTFYNHVPEEGPIVLPPSYIFCKKM